MAHRFSYPALILLAVLGVIVPASAIDPIRIRDLGQDREFLVSEREVYVIHRRATELGGLRRRLEAGVPGAIVSDDTTTRALVTLSAPINLADASQRRDPVSIALPDVEVLPVVYAAGTFPDKTTRRYVTREVLVPLPQGETIAGLAATVGATATRPTIKSGYFILTFPTPYQAVDAVRSLRLRALDAQPLVQYTMAKKAIELPKDQFFSSQWHLVNTGQDNGVPGNDVNILGAWQVTKGSGITLSIVDDCLQTLHPDLTAGCPPLSSNLHHDFNDKDNDPRPGSGDAHGTACAGVAAARQNNGNPNPNTGAFLGVSGAAPETQLLGLRLISGPFTDEDAAGALNWHPDATVVDVSSNSWGPPDGFFGLAGPDILTREALRSAATEGRNGLGQVTCFAAGNGLFYGDDSNYDGLANSRFVLAVAALGHRGTQAIYSEPGANILVTAPSQGDFSSIAITTTDVTGVGGYNPADKNPSTTLNLSNTDYTNTFNGTSSACPLVAGCVALVLGANPLLGWRDVKEIIASTAFRTDEADLGWKRNPNLADPLLPLPPIPRFNGAGFQFNHKYGAGRIDVSAAVARAQTWTNLGAEVAQTRTLASGVGGVVPAAIPDANFIGMARNFSFAGDPNIRVEQIEIIVDITHPHRSDLEVSIMSPDGTLSLLATPHPAPFPGSLDTDADFKDYTIDFATNNNVRRNQGWTFTTTHHWGENSNPATGVNGKGVWQLRVRDNKSGSLGTLNAATVNLYGTAATGGGAAPEARFAINLNRYSPSEKSATQPMDVVRLGSTVGEAFVDYVTMPGTATPGADYTPVTGTLHFTAGNTLADTQIVVPISQDMEAERTESFFVMLKNPVNGSLGGGIASVDIYDDELNEVTVVATDPEARESDGGLPSDTGTFTISRQTAQPTPLTVRFALTGTAILGNTVNSDYTTDILPAGLTAVTIPALANSATVSIIPRNDNVMEGTETVVLTISDDPAYTAGLAKTAAVNIRDNDLPQIQLIATDDFGSENPTGTGSCRVQRVDSIGQPLISDQPLTVFLDYRGTQIPPTQLGNNFTVTANAMPVTNTVEIPAGSDHVDLTITPLNDTVYQPTKTIVLDIQVNPNYTFVFGFLSSAKVNVVEDDPVPESTLPTVSIGAPSAKSFTAPGTVTGSGTATDNDQVKRVTYRVNAAAWKVATFNPGPNGPWTADLTPDLIFGTNRLEVQSIDAANNLSKIAVKQFEYVDFEDLTTVVVGPGALSNEFVGTTSQQVGKTISITAKPAAGSVFNGWTGLVTSNNPTITFAMPGVVASATANFVASPFVADIAGTYSGLLRGANFTAETSGYITLKLVTNGLITGKLTLNNISYSLKGAFTGSGKFDATIARKNDLPLAIHLDIDTNVAGTKQITGVVSFGSFTSNVVADRAAYDKTHPAPATLVKSYTLLLPPAVPIGDAQKDPRGNGIGTMTIDDAGIVKWKGTLADGSKVSQSQALTKNNTWPLFLSLYKKSGVMLGDVVMDLVPLTTDLTGAVNWLKPGNSTDHYFPFGFKIVTAALKGSIFEPKPDGTRALDGFLSGAENGKITIKEGSIGANLTHKLTIGTDNSVVVTDPSFDELSLKINGKTGILTGTFVHPTSGKKTKIDGILFQKEQKAFGQFLGTLPQKEANPQTGHVTIEHVP